MGRFALILLLCLGLCAPHAHAGPGSSFPRPAGLEPAVRFWTKVYTEVDTNGGFIHDDWRPGIIYETLRFDPGTSSATQDAAIDRARRRYAAALSTLGSGRRQGLTATERRVLALWPNSVTNRELRAAAERVRFQRGQADKFRAGLIRSGAWDGFIRRTFEEMDLPPDLAVLPHVESSFNPGARSHAGAAGMWQFTRLTGKAYLRIDDAVDERLDPHASTVAAGRLLQTNYRHLGSWPLAITAYNHGLAGMRRAVAATGSHDIGTIVARYDGPSFGFASRNFYACFLAALDIAKHPEPHFGKLRRARPDDHPQISMPAYLPVTSISRAFGVDQDTLRELNPALQQAVWRGAKHVPKGYRLRLPPGTDARGVELKQLAQVQGHQAQRSVRYHTVRRGETLSGIATRYDTTTKTLAALNGLRTKDPIRVGQTLKLPSVRGTAAVTRAELKPAAARAPAAGNAAQAKPTGGSGQAGARLYTVKRGDTLSDIAARHDVAVAELMRLNGLRDANRIRPGQTLKLPAAGVVAARAKSAGGRTVDRALRPAVYEVKAGDTLIDIARRHGVTTDQLLAANALSNAALIRPGQVLQIAVD
jgi:membrane-bound lytic murein transglycosylase D